jgi:hypothetical protein
MALTFLKTTLVEILRNLFKPGRRSGPGPMHVLLDRQSSSQR